MGLVSKFGKVSNVDTSCVFFYKFGPKPQMLLSLRKIANIILEEFEAATCDISERCFLFHIFTFLCSWAPYPRVKLVTRALSHN